MAKKRTVSEVPGNTLASQAMVDRLLGKTGKAVHQMGHRIEMLVEEGIEIKQVRLKQNLDAAGDWLAVVTARTESSHIVAFHSADGFVECLEGLCSKMTNGSVRWREDEHAK